jgi:hypothetical protein
VPADGRGERQGPLDPADRKGVRQSRTQVGLLASDAVHRHRFLDGADPRLGPLGEAGVVASVPIVGRVRLAVLGKPFGGELAQALQHRELGELPAAGPADEILVDE